MQTVYEAAGKVNTRVLRSLVHRILESLPGMPDQLPPHILKPLKLPDRWTAIRDLHFPPPDSDLRLLNAFRSPAQYRLIFEEFFWLECGLELKRARARLDPGIGFQLNERVRERIKQMLPFKPTGAQKRVLAEIAHDMAAPHPMYRLLQGDVGSGKTLVAAEAAIIAIENGFRWRCWRRRKSSRRSTTSISKTLSSWANDNSADRFEHGAADYQLRPRGRPHGRSPSIRRVRSRRRIRQAGLRRGG
jgi:RecG-like helicase